MSARPLLAVTTPSRRRKRPARPRARKQTARRRTTARPGSPATRELRERAEPRDRAGCAAAARWELADESAHLGRLERLALDSREQVRGLRPQEERVGRFARGLGARFVRRRRFGAGILAGRRQVFPQREPAPQVRDASVAYSVLLGRSGCQQPPRQRLLSHARARGAREHVSSNRLPGPNRSRSPAWTW